MSVSGEETCLLMLMNECNDWITKKEVVEKLRRERNEEEMVVEWISRIDLQLEINVLLYRPRVIIMKQKQLLSPLYRATVAMIVSICP